MKNFSKQQKLRLLLLALAVIIILALLLLPGREAPPAAPVETVATLQTLPPVTAAPPSEAPPETADDAPAYPDDIGYTDGTGSLDLDEYGTYSGVDDVAYYLHVFGHLPDNYLTKAEAEAEGWVSGQGNLWDVAYGMSIGGDRFGNREGLLPKGETYYECDVNYTGGYRGSERIIYTADGDVYYTADHYESFTRLY